MNGNPSQRFPSRGTKLLLYCTQLTESVAPLETFEKIVSSIGNTAKRFALQQKKCPFLLLLVATSDFLEQQTRDNLNLT